MTNLGDRRYRLPPRPGRTLLLIAALWLIVAHAAWLRLATDRPAPTPGVVGIDPNVAPWWELTALPGIGQGIAHSIIAYREAHACTSDHGNRIPVFTDGTALIAVRGIGPVRARRMAPYLSFPTQPIQDQAADSSH